MYKILEINKNQKVIISDQSGLLAVGVYNNGVKCCLMATELIKPIQKATRAKSNKRIIHRTSGNKFVNLEKCDIVISGLRDILDDGYLSTSKFTEKYATIFCKYLCLYDLSEISMASLFECKPASILATISKFLRIGLIREVGGKFEIVPEYSIKK